MTGPPPEPDRASAGADELVPQTGLAAPGLTVSDLLDTAPTSRFHHRAVFISGMGFFTDAYDLFVIAIVATLTKTQWHLSTTQTSWVTGSAILAAFFGAVVFGRLADVLGRKAVYTVVAAIMIVGALASALAPGFLFLVVARFVLGLGIGGDYPVSAVLMSEYANTKDRGRLVGLVFSMQALGLIVGPLVALVLLSSGMSDNLTWRILLALGAVPAAAVVLHAVQDARIAPVPGPGSGQVGAGRRATAGLRRGSDRRLERSHPRNLPSDGPAPVPRQPPHARTPTGDSRHLVPL